MRRDSRIKPFRFVKIPYNSLIFNKIKLPLSLECSDFIRTFTLLIKHNKLKRMKDLFAKKEMLELATNELGRIKDAMEMNSVRIDTAITSFGEFVEKNVAETHDELVEVLTVATLQEGGQVVISALDLVIKGSTDLREKVVNYLNGLANDNPIAALKVEFALKPVTEQDIVNAVTALIDVNGATTTLEVKTYLRDKGFKVDQDTVHKALNEMYNKNYLSFQMKSETIPGKGTVQFRNYTEGSEYYTIDQLGFQPVDDEDDTVTAPVATTPGIVSKELSNIANQQFTNIVERNKAIMTAKNFGHSNKDIAEAFGMSERYARKIITGK